MRMAKRSESSTKTGWAKLRMDSVGLRHRIASVIQEAETIGRSVDMDAIAGWQALQGELAEWNTAARDWLERASALLRLVESAKGEQLETLSQRIVKRLADRGHTVFGDADLLIVDGIAHVELEPAKGRAWVNDLPIDSFAPGLVVETFKDKIVRLRKLTAEPAVTLERLLAAYDREVAANGVRSGSPVQTTALLLQL